mmetsp:Transcript_3342/g.6338  ORF Transcript_3342/g.6338 Transcript_3342/m.6338 type:complete len:104 (+) Transcript_3342:5746-6057(+)
MDGMGEDPSNYKCQTGKCGGELGNTVTWAVLSRIVRLERMGFFLFDDTKKERGNNGEDGGRPMRALATNTFQCAHVDHLQQKKMRKSSETQEKSKAKHNCSTH